MRNSKNFTSLLLYLCLFIFGKGMETMKSNRVNRFEMDQNCLQS